MLRYYRKVVQGLHVAFCLNNIVPPPYQMMMKYIIWSIFIVPAYPVVQERPAWTCRIQYWQKLPNV
ncbi:hypothetical protein P0940_07190 [Acinetobacter nosocomialis]|nr:hypothetical protein [Acinetobacter nosocomialis]